MYSRLAHIYDMMYQTFINYDEEFEFYSKILNKYKANSLFELGCGTGSLASRFIQNGFPYTGIDLSDEMLELAKIKNPHGDFIKGDMRNFKLENKKQACVIAGRTISYLLNDDDVIDCFKAVSSNLEDKGILCFDSIDSEKFIPSILNGKQIRHEAEFKNRKLYRNSFWLASENGKGIFKWKSSFFEEKENLDPLNIGEDESELRSFSKKEMKNFLEQCNFKIESIEDRMSYAFETFVVVAKKNS